MGARVRLTGLATTLTLVTALAAPGLAFTNVAVGDPIESVEMPTLAGAATPLLGEDTVSVMLFFRPDQEHSLASLMRFAGLVGELQDRPLHWVAIVSDRHPEAQVRSAIDAAGWTKPVLVDHGDALYGRLGVRLHPVVAVVDEDHQLASYQHFLKVNFLPVVRARILHALGEIEDDALARALDPARTDRGGDTELARRNHKLAQMLHGAGKHTKALETVRKSLELDPLAAQTHALLGAILAATDDCPGALAAFEQALALDPGLVEGMEGRERCAEK